MKMLARPIVVLLVVLLACRMSADTAADEVARGLVLEKAFPLENVTGRIDHMAIDPELRRLAIAELGNNSVDILDLSNGRVAPTASRDCKSPRVSLGQLISSLLRMRAMGP